MGRAHHRPRVPRRAAIESRAEPGHEDDQSAEHQVNPLELFFDLVFVFAITQVTRLLAADPTGRGVLRGMLVLAALWWAWDVYAWLTSAIDVDEGPSVWS
jgi:low temperature requirement protein LtrA